MTGMPPALSVRRSNFGSQNGRGARHDIARVETEEGEAQQASYFQTYENKGGGERVGSVTLPLQRDLRYSDLAQYETANLGLAGGALEGAMQGQNPFAGAIV